MKKVIIREKYNTSLGKIIQVDNDIVLNVGDKVLGSDGVEYTIKQIIMSSKPGEDTVGLVIEYNK